MQPSRMILAAAALVAAAAAGADPAPPPGAAMASRSRTAGNALAYIPPQCCTRTVDAGGRVHTPCYVGVEAPDFACGEDMQLACDFPEPALLNC